MIFPKNFLLGDKPVPEIPNIYPPPAQKRLTSYRKLQRPYVCLAMMLFAVSEMLLLFLGFGFWLVGWTLVFVFVSLFGLFLLKIVLPFYDVYTLKKKCRLRAAGRVVGYDAIRVLRLTEKTTPKIFYAPIVEVEIDGHFQRRIINDYTPSKINYPFESDYLLDPDGYDILPVGCRLTRDGFSNVCAGIILTFLSIGGMILLYTILWV